MVWSGRATGSWEELGPEELPLVTGGLASSLSRTHKPNAPLPLTTFTTSLVPKSHFPPPHLAPAPTPWPSQPLICQLQGKAHWPCSREEATEQAQQALPMGSRNLPLGLVTLLQAVGGTAESGAKRPESASIPVGTKEKYNTWPWCDKETDQLTSRAPSPQTETCNPSTPSLPPAKRSHTDTHTEPCHTAPPMRLSGS